MEYTIFADTNVFLDALLYRSPSDIYCKELFNITERRQVQLYTSSACLLTVMYYLKKSGMPNTDITKVIEYLLNFILLIPTDKNSFILGFSSGFTDLEDAVLYYTAFQIKGIDYFITSNIKDFKKASDQLPVISPKQFMALYNQA